MSDRKYVIGVDFGTESGRALLVEVATGEEIAAAVHPYANGVIDETLPESGVRLDPDWALQDPNDYLEVCKQAIPAVLKQSGVDPADVIGLATDFTACTILPVTADGTPLCFLPEYRARPMPGSSSGSTMRRSPKPIGSTPRRGVWAIPFLIATAAKSAPSGWRPRRCSSWTRTPASTLPLRA